MKLTLHEKPFEVTDGRLLARFLGAYDHYNPQAKNREGKPIGQQIKWVFAIAEGEDTGKEVMTLTHRACGLETSAGKMLMAIADDAIDIGQEIELNKFVNAYYRISIENGFVSTKQLPSFVGYRRPDGQTPTASHDTPGDALGSIGEKDKGDPVPF